MFKRRILLHFLFYLLFFPNFNCLAFLNRNNNVKIRNQPYPPPDFRSFYAKLLKNYEQSENNEIILPNESEIHNNKNVQIEITPATTSIATTTERLKWRPTRPKDPVKYTTTTTPRPTTDFPLNGCKETRYGQTWTAARNEDSRFRCSDLCCDYVASGYAKWFCSAHGRFEGIPDLSQCKSQWIKNITEIIDKELNEGGPLLPNKTLEHLDQFNQDLKNNYYFGDEIPVLLNLVSKLIVNVDNANSTTLKTNAKLFVNYKNIARDGWKITGKILDNADSWKQKRSYNVLSTFTHTLQVMEINGFELMKRLKHNTSKDLWDEENFREYSFFVSAGCQKKDQPERQITFPMNPASDESFLTLPWKKLNDSDDFSYFVGLTFNSSAILDIVPKFKHGLKYDNEAMLVINGNMMTASLNYNENESLSLGNEIIRIHFKHDVPAEGSVRRMIKKPVHGLEFQMAVLGSATCVFWDTYKNNWSTEGCTLRNSGRDASVCECNHLSSFALLMDRHLYSENNLALEILSLFLSAVSSIGLIIIIIIFTIYKELETIQTKILVRLSSFLLIGNILVIFFLDRSYFNLSKGICYGTGILIHYVFLTAFAWMAISGIQLYKSIILVFESRKSYWIHFQVLGFAPSLIIVAITVSIGEIGNSPSYEKELFCWLQGNFIWTFMGPVLGVILLNIAILGITLRKTWHLEKETHPLLKNKFQKKRKKLYGLFFLTFLLGITWIFGYVILSGNYFVSIIFAYIFTVLNASQGTFLFIFYCIFNEKVRNTLRKKFKKESVTKIDAKESSKTTLTNISSKFYYSSLGNFQGNYKDLSNTSN